MKASDNPFPSVLYEEVAANGSTTSTPAASYGRLFLGLDGIFRWKDSSGAVHSLGDFSNPMTTKGDMIIGDTNGVPIRLAAGTAGLSLVSNGPGALPSYQVASGGVTTPVTTTNETGSVAGSVPHPELQDGNLSGAAAIDMSGAATGTGVSVNVATGMAGRVVFSNASYQYWDVASSIGTGNFDLRCRVTDTSSSVPAAGSTGLLFFGVTDSSRTSTTGLYTRITAIVGNRSSAPEVQAYTGLGTTAITPIAYFPHTPLVLRVARVGTTVTRYISFNEGLSWVTLGNSTSSLNVAKVGVWGNPNGQTTTEIIVHWVRSF